MRSTVVYCYVIVAMFLLFLMAVTRSYETQNRTFRQLVTYAQTPGEIANDCAHTCLCCRTVDIAR